MTDTTINMIKRIKTGIMYIKVSLKFENAEIGPSFSWHKWQFEIFSQMYVVRLKIIEREVTD